MSDWANSPFLVPIVAFIAWAAVVGFRTLARYKVRKLQSQERLLAIEKGQPLPPEPNLDLEDRKQRTPEQSTERRIAFLRTAGIVCLTTGIGTFLFFAMLARVLDERDVLCGAAAGLIPMAIGAGLLIDVRIQSRSLKEAKENTAKEQAAAPAQQPPAGYLE